VRFCSIEYGIAQLGALLVWLKANRKKAIADFRAALELAGTRTMPKLFAESGARFNFFKKTLKPLMQAVSDELASLKGQ
jgi:oligoendopeptidase F